MDHNLESSRKRARSSSPTPGGRRGSTKLSKGSSSHTSTSTSTGTGTYRHSTATRETSQVDLQFAALLQSSDRNTRNNGLNKLLSISSRHDANYALSTDHLLHVLADIVIYDCLEFFPDEEEDEMPSKDDSNYIHNKTEIPIFSSHDCWLSPPTQKARVWAKHCQEKLQSPHAMTQPVLQTMEVILAILRNLSFVSANFRLLVYTERIMAILVGCLYQGVDSNQKGRGDDATSGSGGGGDTMNLALSAMQTLIHLAPYLDISGQKCLADTLFYAPPSSDKEGPMVPTSTSTTTFKKSGLSAAIGTAHHKYGQTVDGHWGFGGLLLAKKLDNKEDTVADISKDFLLSLTSDHLVSIWSIFAGLCFCLTGRNNKCSTKNKHSVLQASACSSSPSRPVIIMAIDLLQELINHARIGVVGSVDQEDSENEVPTVRAVLVHMPASMISCLTNYLYVPRLGPDSLDYVDPVHNIVTRVTSLKLKMGYDLTVDTDVRDRVLDVLVPLLELDSPRMAARVGTIQEDEDKTGSGRDLDSKSIPHLTIRTRFYDALVPIVTATTGRNEASTLATQLFRELSKAPENKLGLEYVQERLVTLASKDVRVAQLVWNHLYLVSDDDDNLEAEGAEKDNDEEPKNDEGRAAMDTTD